VKLGGLGAIQQHLLERPLALAHVLFDLCSVFAAFVATIEFYYCCILIPSIIKVLRLSLPFYVY
jgi:hypothetical protein